MATATTMIGTQRYTMQVNSGGGNVLTADEPVSLGGQNLGFSPDELLCAALGTCTAATLRMYADRKQWPLTGVSVHVHFEREAGRDETILYKELQLEGELDEAQIARLIDIAGKCPMHKTLSNSIDIETVIVDSNELKA